MKVKSRITVLKRAREGLLYVEAGAVKWRGKDGTVTTLVPAPEYKA